MDDSGEIRDPIAALDQALRGFTDFARVIAGYRAALIEQGFTPTESLMLVAAYQQHLLSSITPTEAD